MSLLKIFILATICAIASWFLFLQDKVEQLSARSILLPSISEQLETGELRSISISHPGEVFQIDCAESNSCTLKDPPLEPIDQKAFLKLVQNLDSLKALSEISAEQQKLDGGDFGVLGAPLKIEIRGAKHSILYFGSSNPITHRRYVRVEGDPNIYAVDDAVFNELLIKKREIRPTHPLNFDEKAIISIASSAKNFSYHFTKTDNNWELKDNSVDVDQRLLPEILKRIASITTVEFIDIAPPILLQQLKSPFLILDLLDSKESKQRLSFYSIDLSNLPGKKESEKLIQRLYFMAIAGRQTLFQILPPRLSDFNNPPLYFQNTTPFSSVGDVRSYKIAIELSTGEKLNSLSDKLTATQQDSLTRLFEQLRKVQLVSTVAPESSDSPQIEITVTDASGKPASLKIFSKIESADDSQKDAPYLAEILYFSTIKVHAIMSAEQVAAIDQTVHSIMSK